MKKVEPKTLSGFMELLPSQQIFFDKIKNTIKANFEKFGFLPMDTPIIESTEVLNAKAGGETEKQIFNVTNGLLSAESNMSLRFDLTVPLAKYVAKEYNNLIFPFRRYQIGKVFRGERPQKGRYREFYQCDVDIISNDNLSLCYDAELPSLISNIFKQLEIGEFVVYVSNRKILRGLFEELNLKEKEVEILRVIDKAEKIGNEKVGLILIDDLNIEPKTVDYIMSFIKFDGTNAQILKKLKESEIKNEMYLQGVSELDTLVQNMRKMLDEKLFKINLTITRGLDYYTGTVFETYLTNQKSLGSICSGGRYENLSQFYTDKNFSGVGISVGLTRIFSHLISQNETLKSMTQVLIVPFDDDFSASISLANFLRQNNINTEIYFQSGKFKNKLTYANKLNIPYVIIIGEDEIKGGYYTLKNMNTSQQKQVKKEQIPAEILLFD